MINKKSEVTNHEVVTTVTRVVDSWTKATASGEPARVKREVFNNAQLQGHDGRVFHNGARIA